MTRKLCRLPEMLSGAGKKTTHRILLESGSGNKKKVIGLLYLPEFKLFNNIIKEKNVSKTGGESDRRFHGSSIQHKL